MKNRKPQIIFGSKAETLERLRPALKSAVVLEQVRFDVAAWRADPEAWLKQIVRTFPACRVAVRSSALAEDRAETSGAGRFRSVLDVPTNDIGQLRQAIEHVIASFGRDREIQAGDKVFVQPQIADLAASGVLLTRDPETAAPYVILNIDRRSGRSDSVTSGAQIAFDTFYLTRSADLTAVPAEVRACVMLARELETLTQLDALDVEFGIDRMGVVYLFQVRPIARRARKFHISDQALTTELKRMRTDLVKRFRPHLRLLGRTTVFGTMPDWNPAEMIGIAPRQLALTLYQRLIGRRAWSAARAQLGYRDARPVPLIVSFAGRPYVDVRASLNSFLPAALANKTAIKIVGQGVDLLRANPRLHDKLEFEIAITCRSIDFETHSPRLRQAGLTDKEITNFGAHLLALTDNLLRGADDLIDRQFAALAQLETRRQKLLQAMPDDLPGLGRRVHLLLADCERYGTLPFAILARCAFIALAWLRSLRAVGVLSTGEYESLLHSIPTVASELSHDLARHAAGLLSTEDFLARYGHLRPSSYDITSPNYAAAPELYLAHQASSVAPAAYPDPQVAVALLESHAEQIERLLRAAGFESRLAHLRNFILRSIPAREHAKFLFMQNINAALETIAEIGERVDLKREAISFLPIELIERLATQSPHRAARRAFQDQAQIYEERWQLTAALHLPHVLRAPEDVDVFQLEEWTPNFISTRRAVAPPVVLESGTHPEDLDGRIVLIRAADPGYDWIFGHTIAGLVTQYGGAASHMAIRAAEFGLPAVIGCGETIFESLCSARLVELDCTNKKVRGLP